jgi:hypothetical protein
MGENEVQVLLHYNNIYPNLNDAKVKNKDPL